MLRAAVVTVFWSMAALAQSATDRGAWSPYDDTPEVSAKELSGQVMVNLLETGLGVPPRRCSMSGNPQGLELQRFEGEEGFQGRLGSTEVKALLETVRRLRFWALTDAEPSGLRDGAWYDVEVRYGSAARRFKVHSTCPGSFEDDGFAAMEGRPARTPKPCPQRELISALQKVCATATQRTREKPPAEATELVRFVAATTAEREVPPKKLDEMLRRISWSGCIAAARHANPDLKIDRGELRMTLALKADGSVTASSLEPSRLGLTPWGACLLKLADQVSFPRSSRPYQLSATLTVE